MSVQGDTDHGASAKSPSLTYDVLIVGAGLSGVDAACRLQTECPGKTFRILEARSAIGGTWDLFRYPGVRSDSDMSTLGFPFRPWTEEESIAGGDKIARYIRETAQIYGVDRQILFGHQVLRAAWSSQDARWTLETTTGGRAVSFSGKMLYMCCGYYRYDQGYSPDFPGLERFKGQVVHPQFWPESLDYAGKRIVVIGSGATAVTLVPTLALTAGHVTMLQRSPSYVLSRPSRDRLAKSLRRWAPPALAEALIRWKNILIGLHAYRFARKRPEKARRFLLNELSKRLSAEIDIPKHFTPSYDPWDQRICLAPDADLLVALNEKRARIVTDHIETFTETGIGLRSGETLEADIIVTATGLILQVLGGVELTVDDAPVTLTGRLVYKGMMADGVPNLAFSFGYTNASWTLKCDLTARYICRLLKYMDRHGHDICAPRQRDPTLGEQPMIALNSGYVRRGEQAMPRQGSSGPWRLHQNYLLDLAAIRHAKLNDGIMEFRSKITPVNQGGYGF